MEQIDYADREWAGDEKGEFVQASRKDVEDRNAARKACTFCYYSHYDKELHAWECYLEDHHVHEFSNRDCQDFMTMADRVIDAWCGQVEDREIADRVEARELDELDEIRSRSCWDEYDATNQAALADSG